MIKECFACKRKQNDEKSDLEVCDTCGELVCPACRQEIRNASKHMIICWVCLHEDDGQSWDSPDDEDEDYSYLDEGEEDIGEEEGEYDYEDEEELT